VVRDVLRSKGSPIAEMSDAISLFNRSKKDSRGFRSDLSTKWNELQAELCGKELTVDDWALFEQSKKGARKVSLWKAYAHNPFRMYITTVGSMVQEPGLSWPVVKDLAGFLTVCDRLGRIPGCL
jgi:hypothetical protein